MTTTAAAGTGFWVAGGVAPRPSRAAIDEISFASIGVGGKGASDSRAVGRHGNMFAICDIDEGNLGKAAAWFQICPGNPQAATGGTRKVRHK